MTDAPPSVIIAPSLLAADATRYGAEIADVVAGGANWLHLDVMDGHFVPNLTFGPPIIRALRPLTSLPFDVHLMIESPARSLDQYIEAGANGLTLHVETDPHAHRSLQRLRDAGIRAGITLNPSTPVSALEHIVDWVDLVLVMSVSPGFGGQSFIPSALSKVRQLAQWRASRGLDFVIEIDGGIDPLTIGPAARAGATAFVAGTAIFGESDRHAAIARLRQNALS